MNTPTLETEMSFLKNFGIEELLRKQENNYRTSKEK